MSKHSTCDKKKLCVYIINYEVVKIPTKNFEIYGYNIIFYFFCLIYQIRFRLGKMIKDGKIFSTGSYITPNH